MIVALVSMIFGGLIVHLAHAWIQYRQSQAITRAVMQQIHEQARQDALGRTLKFSRGDVA